MPTATTTTAAVTTALTIATVTITRLERDWGGSRINVHLHERLW